MTFLIGYDKLTRLIHLYTYMKNIDGRIREYFIKSLTKDVIYGKTYSVLDVLIIECMGIDKLKETKKKILDK